MPANRAAAALATLLASGDVGEARARAQAILADAATPEEERAAAREVFARTGLDRAALIAAAGVLAVQILWTSLLYTA